VVRTLSVWEQEERKRKLLQAIIHQYIKTAKPVGSAFLAEEYKLDLSPATIRHAMAELEEEGFLTHPHTSAGRVPTDKAYRFYVDSLAELQRLAIAEENRLREEQQERLRQLEEVMLSTSKTLSALSKFSGFVMSPKMEQAKFQHLELIPLGGNRVLVVLVADSGVVKHRSVEFNKIFPAELLPPLAKTLNERLRGKVFSDVRDSLLDHIEFLGQRQLDMIEMTKSIARQAFDWSDGQVYLEGAGHMLSLPDFRDYDQLRSLAHLLDEKRFITDALTKDLTETKKDERWPGVSVRIGAENKLPELRNLSVVSATYKVNDRTVGVLGVIGPKRMDYSRMMGLVGSVAKSVSRVLSRLAGG